MFATRPNQCYPETRSPSDREGKDSDLGLHGCGSPQGLAPALIKDMMYAS